MTEGRVSLFRKTVTVQLLITLTSALDSIIMSRALGPAGRGEYAVVITVVTAVQVVGYLSVANGQAYLWSTGSSSRALIANGFMIAAIVGILSCSCAWLIATGPARSGLHLAKPSLLALSLATVPLGLLFNYLTNLFVLGDRLRLINLANLAGAVVELSTVIGLAVSHHLDVTTMIAVWVTSVSIPAIMLCFWAQPRVRDLSWRLLIQTLSIGIRYHPGSLFLYLLLDVDVLLLNARVTHNQVGLYSLAVTLAEMVFLVNGIISQVIQPRQMAGNVNDSGLLTLALVRISFALATLVIAAVLAISPVLLPLVYGDAYRGSIPALAMLAPAVIAFGGVQVVGPYLTRLNRPLLVSTLIGSAMAINVGLNLLLIPRLGIVGSSIASSVAYAILASTYVIWLVRSVGGSTSDVVPRIADLKIVAGALRRRQASEPITFERLGVELIPRGQDEL